MRLTGFSRIGSLLEMISYALNTVVTLYTNYYYKMGKFPVGNSCRFPREKLLVAESRHADIINM